MSVRLMRVESVSCQVLCLVVLLLGVTSMPALASDVRGAQSPAADATAVDDSLATAGAGLTITVVPTCPPEGEAPYPPGTTIVGDEILFLPGASKAWFDIYVSDWGTAGNSSTMMSNVAGGLTCCVNGQCQPVTDTASCDGGPICQNSGTCDMDLPALQEGTYAQQPKFAGVTKRNAPGSICNLGNACNLSGFIDLTRPDILFAAPLLQYVQDTGNGDWQFYSETTFANSVPDTGVPRYVGTFSVTSTAGSFLTGTQAIGVDCADTNVYDQYNRLIPCGNSIPATLTVVLQAAPGGTAGTGEICAGTVPAVSEWGLVVVALVGLIAGSIVFARPGSADSVL